MLRQYQTYNLVMKEKKETAHTIRQEVMTMASLEIGKRESIEWIVQHFSKGSTALDVGACDGKWGKLLNDYLIIDGVEIYTPNIAKHNLESIYRKVFNCDIKDLTYKHYDLIIFGDVLEHMSVEDAQKVLEYAWDRCRNLIVAVPYQWINRSHYGNPYEVHIQDDLTPEIVLERYPKLKPLFIYERYGYYIKGDCL